MSATIVGPGQTVAEPEPKGKEKKGKLPLILGLVVALAAAGAGAWFFLLAPGGGEEKPVPGEVAVLEPIQVNLADGHYLRIGLALQLTAEAHEVDGSMALDAAIEVFSGRPVGEVNRPETREKLRHELEKLLEERYHHDVMGVYFTEFVTQ